MILGSCKPKPAVKWSIICGFRQLQTCYGHPFFFFFFGGGIEWVKLEMEMKRSWIKDQRQNQREQKYCWESWKFVFCCRARIYSMPKSADSRLSMQDFMYLAEGCVVRTFKQPRARLDFCIHDFQVLDKGDTFLVSVWFKTWLLWGSVISIGRQGGQRVLSLMFIGWCLAHCRVGPCSALYFSLFKSVRETKMFGPVGEDRKRVSPVWFWPHLKIPLQLEAEEEEENFPQLLWQNW